MLKPTRICLLASFLCIPLAAYGLEGKAIGVSDGDTLTILDVTKRQHRIRLAEIDAPESKQAFGQRAKQALSRICFGKHVEIRDSSADRYQRVVGTVYCDGVNANSELVRQGMAWVYVQYASKSSPLFALEKAARANKLGLWADPHATPPWEFRRAGRAGNDLRRAIPAPTIAGHTSAGGSVRGNRRSKVYHLFHCPSYDAVGPKNRVEFVSEQAADSAGFRKAANCR
ncbi:MAG: nuclease [Thermomicrobiales bacterium]|nr:MAG: nuclease [Thermomicrobiales bacterium]